MFSASQTCAVSAVRCRAVGAPRVELVFKSSLEEAQLRKLDHLIARAQVQRHDRVLDLGFGWGGLSIRLAETIGCRVHGITLSKEQHDLALERVRARGLDHLITFEIVDYRDFAAAHPGEFDRIISVEMIEAVGHNYFANYMAALDRLLAPNGIIVIQVRARGRGRRFLPAQPVAARRPLTRRPPRPVEQAQISRCPDRHGALPRQILRIGKVKRQRRHILRLDLALQPQLLRHAPHKGRIVDRFLAAQTMVQMAENELGEPRLPQQVQQRHRVPPP